MLPPSRGQARLRRDAVRLARPIRATIRGGRPGTPSIDEESTLAFFATDFRQELVGPGIGLATYGGALFLFPPVPIPDIWRDKRLDFTETLEERLLAAACLHSHVRTSPCSAPRRRGPAGDGWPNASRRNGSTCRSGNSAIRQSSNCGWSMSSTASRCAATRPISFVARELLHSRSWTAFSSNWLAETGGDLPHTSVGFDGPTRELDNWRGERFDPSRSSMTQLVQAGCASREASSPTEQARWPCLIPRAGMLDMPLIARNRLEYRLICCPHSNG